MWKNYAITKFYSLKFAMLRFKTKSDAIRYLLSMGISATRKFSGVGEKVESLKRLEKSKGKFPIELSGGLKDLIDDRHRFK